MKKIKSVVISGYGQVAAFDEQGQQIPELQVSLIELWAKHAQSVGYDPTSCKLELSSKGISIQVLPQDDGFNWDIAKQR